MIEPGDAVVLDFGGLRFGYGSDTTRTVCVGEPTSQIREVHEVVRRAQQAGVDAVRPGVSCQEIDRAARKIISDAEYGEQFIHRTSHGIGVTTHEPPYMVEGEEQPLVPGMCFSVEPGLPRGKVRRTNRGLRDRHIRGREAPEQYRPRTRVVDGSVARETPRHQSPDSRPSYVRMRVPPITATEGAGARPRAGGSEKASAASSTSLSAPVKRPSCWRGAPPMTDAEELDEVVWSITISVQLPARRAGSTSRLFQAVHRLQAILPSGATMYSTVTKTGPCPSPGSKARRASGQ